jgi:hypothetical protein
MPIVFSYVLTSELFENAGKGAWRQHDGIILERLRKTKLQCYEGTQPSLEYGPSKHNAYYSPQNLKFILNI